MKVGTRGQRKKWTKKPLWTEEEHNTWVSLVKQGKDIDSIAEIMKTKSKLQIYYRSIFSIEKKRGKDINVDEET